MEGLNSWLSIPEESDFSLYNIPFGVGITSGNKPRICTRIGDSVIDLYNLALHGYFDRTGMKPSEFEKPALNEFIARGRDVTSLVRRCIQNCFNQINHEPTEESILRESVIHPCGEVKMLMPLQIGDYTDFYSSIEHATNVGKMFRDPANALLPNWRHIPVGYHGRASSILLSGAEVRRPCGQIKPANLSSPVFSPTQQLDFELETAFVVGRENPLGQPVPISEAEGHIFGMVLFNDLSARDIQSWEYVPLGPFLSKNFASVISPWVVTLEALEPFRCAGPVQEPMPLPYLQTKEIQNFDIQLEVDILTSDGIKTTVSHSNFKHLYWSMGQQLAHHTVNGCNLRVGDLCGSGTISGREAGSYGSLLELTWRGENPLTLQDGTLRTFLQDHDTVIIRGFAQKGKLRVGFGEAAVTILPAINPAS